MIISMDPIEARILGSLIEKSLTTPDQYPLTFNALLNSCNQKTSREPVMNLDPETVDRGIRGLTDKKLVERLNVHGTRVPKFRHHIENLLTLANAQEIGALCVLLLRGPQTPGEIKVRTDRLCEFASTAEVESLLQDLSTRSEGAIVARLPRQPGQKETRYQQLFTGPAPTSPEVYTPSKTSAPVAGDRISLLEERVAALEEVVKTLEERLSKPV